MHSVVERDECGASAVEYGLLVTAVAAVIAMVVFMFGGVVADLFDDSCGTVAGEISNSSC